MTARVIAIDGPSASGKSSVAARIAAELKIAYINTGSMYRAVAWVAAAQKITAANADESKLIGVLQHLQMEYVQDAFGVFCLKVNGEFPTEALRTSAIAELTSKIATFPAVRSWLREKQRKMANSGWIVMEGRDIGTVVFPDAAMKFFLTASPLERARRRLAQEGAAAGGTLEEVAAKIAERDYQDSTRPVAPLKVAEGARVVDSSDNTFDETVKKILSMICVHESSYRVPYADTDQMGVVYYANYLEYFERSRTEMLRSVGLSYKTLEERGWFLPVSEAHCLYKGSAKYDDLLTFRSYVTAARGARLVIASEVCRDGKVLVSGTVTLGCVDANHRLCRLPEELITACSIYQAKEA